MTTLQASFAPFLTHVWAQTGHVIQQAHTLIKNIDSSTGLSQSNIAQTMLITTVALAALAVLYSILCSSLLTIGLSMGSLCLAFYAHYLNEENLKMRAHIFNDQRQIDEIKRLETKVAEASGLVENCSQILANLQGLDTSQQVLVKSQQEVLAFLQQQQDQAPKIESSAQQLVALVTQFSIGQHDVFGKFMEQMRETTTSMQAAREELEASKRSHQRSREQLEHIASSLYSSTHSLPLNLGHEVVACT